MIYVLYWYVNLGGNAVDKMRAPYSTAKECEKAKERILANPKNSGAFCVKEHPRNPYERKMVNELE